MSQSIKTNIKAASFNYLPENPKVNQTITFNPSSSYDPDGLIVSYTWGFGDNITASGKIVNHAYSNPGDYTVILTVTDNNGTTNSISKKVTVTAASSNPSQKTIYSPDNYPTIQEAINHARPKDIIIVRDGTYNEHIVVNVSNITIRSENGSENCIINGGGKDDVVKITANNNTIEGFTITGGSKNGVKIEFSGNTMANNNIYNNGVGIYLDKSSTNTITSNKITYNKGYGILLYESSNNDITSNNISNNRIGIRILKSSNNNITSNNISDNFRGILLCKSSGDTVTHNSMTNNGIVVWSDEIEHWNSHTIENNTANGKQIYYFKNKVGGKVPKNAGQIILADCTGMKIEDLNISNTDVGIEVGFSTGNTIRNVKISNNNWSAIALRHSSDNNIISNNIFDNRNGIMLFKSGNNNISFNSISNNNLFGIRMFESSNNNMLYNNISNNSRGIMLFKSNSNTTTCNSMTNNGIIVLGDEIEHWNSHTIENNTANGKPIYYFKNKVGGKVPKNAGQIILADCTGMKIEDLNISNTDVGIEVGFSTGNTVRNVNISNNNWLDILVFKSSNNNIISNSLSNNK